MADILCDFVINAVDVQKLNKIERLIHLNLIMKFNDLNNLVAQKLEKSSMKYLMWLKCLVSKKL